MSGRIWIGLALALLATAALAAGPGAVRKQAEASMLVTGQVRIEPDGSVSGWELDRRDTLPEVVTELIDRAVPAWRFEPVLVDGKPAKVEAAMSLRLVANRLDDGDYQVSVRSSYFGDDAKGSEGMVKEGRADETVHAIQMRPPSYPPQAAKAGIRGTVYLVLRIDREGTVDDVFVEQVNLRNIGSERQMDLMRAVLAKPTADAPPRPHAVWASRPLEAPSSVSESRTCLTRDCSAAIRRRNSSMTASTDCTNFAFGALPA